MLTLHVMCGLPRSGKSTWARHRVEPGTDSAPIVSPDCIRVALHGEPFIGRAEPFVWATAQVMVRALFEAGHTAVILDACNVTQEHRRMWEQPDWDTRFIHITTPLAVCLERAQQDSRFPASEISTVIERMARQWELFRPDQTVTAYLMERGIIAQTDSDI